MYTINKNKGIGEVIESNDTMLIVFFSETRETKELLKSYTKVYATYQDAMIALDPEMTEDEANKRYAEMQAENAAEKERKAAISRMEEMNAASSQELKKHI